MGADLAAVGCFFVAPWTQPAPALKEGVQAWLLIEAAIRLRALNRLTEAREPMRIGLERQINQKDVLSAAVSASNLSELELALGDILSALRDADLSVELAEQVGEVGQRIINHTTHADALHQVGRPAEARTRFEEAEAMQRKRQREFPLLYSLQGFRFCELLLANVVRAAWSVVNSGELPPPDDAEAYSATLLEVEHRATQTLEWGTRYGAILDVAHDNLTLGRVALCGAVIEPSSFDIRNSESLSHIAAALHGLFQAGDQTLIAGALLTRAWLRSVQGQPERARADLDEAQHLAERGPMPLHLADVHLHRARLFRDRDELQKARALIEKHGYGRRLPELEDAEAAAQSW
jgi:tetratricopeptide (TPR) repeat protein